jgi:hypothetical protein
LGQKHTPFFRTSTLSLFLSHGKKVKQSKKKRGQPQVLVIEKEVKPAAGNKTIQEIKSVKNDSLKSPNNRRFFDFF